MLINMVLPGAAGSAEEPFAFTYSGSFVDERDANGIGDVTLNTSGQLVTSGKTVTVKVYILAGGGGAACDPSSYRRVAGGGGGGNQTIEIELVPGTYEITIGTGGAALNRTADGGTYSASSGGNTTAFGYTSTGGTGGTISNIVANTVAGAGGSPNGGTGTVNTMQGMVASGGTPNGGSASNRVAYSGGNGLVRITFS